MQSVLDYDKKLVIFYLRNSACDMIDFCAAEKNTSKSFYIKKEVKPGISF